MAAGTVTPGDAVVVLPGGAQTTVTAVETADGPLPAAGAGRSVTIRLADDIDLSRGDVLAAAAAAPTVTAELDAVLCWLADKPLRAGARLLVKHGTRTTQAIVGALGDQLDTETVTWVRPARPARDQRHRPSDTAYGGPASRRRLRRDPCHRQLPAHRPAHRQHPGAGLIGAPLTLPS